MGRPREFEETEVLDAAMYCFWTQGYEATSVRDLAREMRMTGASLYNAFGDKRTLYRRALEHYVAELRDRIARLESGLAPLEAIRAFFEEVVERSASDPHHRGCMLVNATVEPGPDDPDLRVAMATQWQHVEAFFRCCLVAGQQAGTITKAQSPETLAPMLLAVLLGIRVLARTNPGRDALAGAASGVLALLERPRRP